METIRPDKRTFWKVNHTNGEEFQGLTDLGQETATAQPIIYDTNADTIYPPLPNVGTELSEGYIYSYNGGMVEVRQSHTRTNLSPEETPALFSVYRANTEGAEWVTNEEVVAGDTRTFEGNTYECIQNHTTQQDWTPPSVTSLWKVVESGSSEIREWSSYESFEFQNMELGTQVLDAGNTYTLINQGQGFRQPSGEFGHFGWELIN